MYVGRSQVIWNVRYITAQSLENRRGREEKEKDKGQCGKNEARFCHCMLAVASLGIPNGDILILNFTKKTRKRWLTSSTLHRIGDRG